MENNKEIMKSDSWIKKLFQQPFKEQNRVETIVFQGFLHSRTDNILLFRYPQCRIDHEEIKITKLNARLYSNFLVVDGKFLIKSYFIAEDDLLRLEQMEAVFLTTLELPGLLQEMRIDFGEIKTDYFFTPLINDLAQTTFHNEVVLEIPYFITKRNNI
jgi:hypothetical protein